MTSFKMYKLITLLALNIFVVQSTVNHWFPYVSNPIKICLSQSLASHAVMDLGSLRLLSQCLERVFKVEMGCTSVPNPMKLVQFVRHVLDYGLNYKTDKECPHQYISGPCASFGIQAEASILQCKWYISVPQALTINITFYHLHLLTLSSTCKVDKLTFRHHGFSNYSQTFCGKRTPFSFIPGYSTLELALDMPQRKVKPKNKLGFSLFYHIVSKDLFNLPARENFDNVISDPSRIYNYFDLYLVMATPAIKRFTFHINVDFGKMIEACVEARDLSSKMLAFDGPSTDCVLLRKFKLSGHKETIQSFGPSMLLELKTYTAVEKGTPDVLIQFEEMQINILPDIPVLEAFDQKRQIIIFFKNSQFCLENNFIIHCAFKIRSSKMTSFVKMSEILINVELPSVFDCHFGSVIISDKSSAALWKWCGFMSPSLQQVTSSSQELLVKAVLYTQPSDDLYIDLHYELSSCPGINPYDLDINLARNVVEVNTRSHHGWNHMNLVKIYGKCFVVQLIRKMSAENIIVSLQGQNRHEVQEYSIDIQQSFPLFQCSVSYSIMIGGLFSTSMYGAGEIDYYTAHSDPQQNFTFTNRASSLQISTRIMNFCKGMMEDVFITVRDACENLFTDVSQLTRVAIQPFDVSSYEKLSSACSVVSMELTGYNEYRFHFHDLSLCLPHTNEARFPCSVRNSPHITCHSHTDCVLHVEARLVASDICRDDIIMATIHSKDYMLRLAWFINQQKKLLYASFLLERIKHYFQWSGMDNFIGKFQIVSGVRQENSCKLEISQQIKKSTIKPIAYEGTVADGGPAAPCQLKLSDILTGYKDKDECIKAGIRREYLTVENKSYMRVNSSEFSWREAQQFCERHNGSLMSVTSKSEENILMMLLSGGNKQRPIAAFIGLIYDQKVCEIKQSYHHCIHNLQLISSNLQVTMIS